MIILSQKEMEKMREVLITQGLKHPSPREIIVRKQGNLGPNDFYFLRQFETKYAIDNSSRVTRVLQW
jgi:hypothetical protein